MHKGRPPLFACGRPCAPRASPDGRMPPTEDEVRCILLLLRELIFPGYFSKKKGREDSLVAQVHARLAGEIDRALRYTLGASGAGEGASLSASLLSRVPHIRARLWEDIDAFFEGDPAATGTDEIILSYPGLFAIMTHRIAHELWVLGVPLVPRMMSEYAHSKTGIDIHPGAVLGRRFFIDHGTATVIGESAVVGDGVKIYQGVTLGALSTRAGQSLRGKKRHPTVEDRVTVYAGATILGGDTVIGHDSVIGANAFITSSVPPESRVKPPFAFSE